jgi:geranylgeranyl diphosphate synthase, type II
MDFNEKFKFIQNNINTYIDQLIPKQHQFLDKLFNSMRYSLLAGGKRLRPVLMLGVGEIFDCPLDDIMPFAASIEMIHTYSLIHDDLPAMDNDDYRRGRLTNHKIYGDAMAILAGDGLLNYAFENMLQFASQKNNMKYIKAAYEIGRAAGVYGMIGGQAVDVENEGHVISKEVMDFMHNNKTGALITASVTSGAIISEAGADDLARLSDYAHDLGLAFQIIDDILDVIGDEKKLGKKTGSDSINEKATYVSMYGIDKSKEIAKQLSERAINRIQYYGDKALFLKQLTEFLLNRDY